jgi:hypothetical protein
MKTINGLIPLVIACLACAPFCVAASKDKDAHRIAPLKPLPEIPKSIFNAQGRDPFRAFGTDRSVEMAPALQTVSVTDAQLREYERTAHFSACFIKGEQSWAIINGQQFFLNARTVLDPRRPDLKNLEVQPTTIEEDRVVLMLLDGTRRTITVRSK